MKRQFYLFLKENNAWDEFKENAQMHLCTLNLKYNCNFRFTFNSDPEDWIQLGFYWQDSASGHNYWSDIDDKWQKIIAHDNS